MRFSKTTALLAIIPLTLAADCTSSNASPWPFGSGGDSTSGDDTPVGSVTDVCAQFKDDAAAYQACASTALSGECAAVGCDDSSSVGGTSTGDLISNPGDDLISSGDSSDGGGIIKKLRARDTLSCTSDETCYEYTDGSLRCYNLATSDYHDDAGGSGNFLAGTRTGSSGAEASDSSSASSATATASGAGSSAAANTGSATSASATPASGAEMVRADTLVGALGMFAALLL